VKRFSAYLFLLFVSSVGLCADVNAKSVVGNTPPDDAISLNPNNRKNKAETADLLRKHGGKMSVWLRAGESIHVATSAGHIEAVKQHLADGADVNAKDSRGRTPLDYAKRKPEIADLLHKHGGKTGLRRRLAASVFLYLMAKSSGISPFSLFAFTSEPQS